MSWKNAFEPVLGFLFPPRCVSCGEGGALFCAECQSGLSAEKSSLPDTISFYPYADRRIARLVWALKYEGLSGAGAAIVPLMKTVLADELAARANYEGFAAPVLTVVPASRRRLKLYRHNHLEALGEALAAACALTFEPGLLEIARETEKAQMSIKSRDERLVNLQGAFRARDENALRNKNILVLDDVVTTGATLQEARRALTEAGAARVIGLTFAH